MLVEIDMNSKYRAVETSSPNDGAGDGEINSATFRTSTVYR